MSDALLPQGAKRVCRLGRMMLSRRRFEYRLWCPALWFMFWLSCFAIRVPDLLCIGLLDWRCLHAR